MSDAAIASIVTGIVTVALSLIGFLTLYVKLKYGEKKAEELATKAKEVEDKIDNNTSITVAGTQAAATHARAAEASASQAKEATKDMTATINKKLNGGIDSAVNSAIAPLQKTLEEHVKSDEEFMIEVRRSLEEIKKKLK